MPRLSKNDIKKIFGYENVDEEALEILTRQLEKYVKDTEELAAEAAKLDGRNRIEKEDMQDVLRFRRFFQKNPE